jgi:hypothetical protein
MLPMDCHYVAEIRYQECAQAAQVRAGTTVLTTLRLPSLLARRTSFDGVRSWFRRASRSARRPSPAPINP